MIGTLEQAMIDALQAAVDADALGYTLFPTSYAGKLLDSAGQAEASIRLPAAVVIFAGAKVEPLAANAWVCAAQYEVYCCVQHRRNERARRHGDTGGAGSYQVAEDVIQALAGRAFGLGIEPLSVAAIESAYQGQDVSIYRVDFTTKWEIEAPEELPAGAADLARVWVDWDLPGGLPAPETLPAAEGEADAQDNIEIEQES